MIVLPAIDILDGKPVRLYQGDYGQSKFTCCGFKRGKRRKSNQ